MKLVALSVTLEDKLVMPDAKLEVGEFIVRRVVEISKLSDELKSLSQLFLVKDLH